ncbi:MAG: gliding motility-associated C-terminal domain-containing protein, partial [Bacteroidota bacterium]
GTGPFTYDWNTGDETAMLDDLEVGEYALIATSARGCQASANVQLTAPDAMAVQLREVPATCLDPNPALVIQNIAGGVGPYLYATNGEGTFTPVSAFPDTVSAQVGTTTFTLEDSKGCVLTQDFEFAPAPVGDIRITPEFTVITLGERVEIAVLTDLEAAGYRLSPGPDSLLTAPSFFVAPDTTTLYQITAVDDAGCTVSGESLIVVDRFVPVYAPSAFSPNQDGNNDVYRIYGRNNVASFSNFAIFDRWGNRVFDFAGPVGPRDENWGWDGRTSDGRLRQAGVYVFGVTVTFTDGRTKEVKGDLVLVR